MPLYEYECQGCRRTFEILQRVGAGAEGLKCPRCGGSELHKEFSTFAASGTSSAGAACAPSGRFT